MYQIFKNNKGAVVTYDNKIVIKYNYGTRGGAWTATGYFNNDKFTIIKNNGKELNETVVFGTKNARYYIPVIRDAYVKDGKLFVILLRRTTKWGKVYHWEVITK